jgi:molybdopterin-guanine dinucleotide biosynthesis protein A
MTPAPSPLGGLVLAGGRSRRMGEPKALADRAGVPLLVYVAGVLLEACQPVVVSHAPGQRLPPLPGRVELVADSAPGRGPLQALADGLAALRGRCRAVFVTATDLPLLTAAAIGELAAQLRAQDEAVVPVLAGHRQTLAAVYRPELAARAVRLLAGGERRVGALLDGRAVREVAAESLADSRALTSVNTPEELAIALRGIR